MQIRNYLEKQDFLNKNELKESEFINLISNLIALSRPEIRADGEMLHEIHAELHHKHRIGLDIVKRNSNYIKPLSYEELHKMEKSELEKTLNQFCSHAEKVLIVITDTNASELYRLEYIIQHHPLK